LKAKTKEERIYDWALQVSAVEMVKELNKSFRGLVLSNERDTQAVIAIVNGLIGRLTHIGDLADTGLGIPYWDLRDGLKKEETKKGKKS
jgi:hypothetical protein